MKFKIPLIVALLLVITFATFADEGSTFKKEWASAKTDDEKAEALQKLLSNDTEKAVVDALRVLRDINDIPYKVLDAALEGFRSKANPQARQKLIDEFTKGKNLSLCVMLAKTFSTMKDDDKIIDTLIKGIKSNRWQIASASVNAAMQLKSTKFIQPLINALKEAESNKEGRFKWDVVAALRFIINNNNLTSSTDFDGWWQKNKDTFNPDAPPDAISETDKRATTAEPSIVYDVVKSKRVIFVVDISLSMDAKGKVPEIPKEPSEKVVETNKSGEPVQQPDKQPEYIGVKPGFIGTRLEIVKIELKAVIEKQLEEGTLFNIIIFSNSVSSWQGSMVKATKQNKKEAYRFIDTQEPVGGTNTWDALLEAFKDKNVDTIYFLSDGTPTDGPILDRTQILGEVRKGNLSRNVRINTIALLTGNFADHPVLKQFTEDKDACADFMKKMAEESGGTSKVIRD